MQKINNGPEKKCFDLRSQFFVCGLGLAIGSYGITFLLLSSLFPKKSHPNLDSSNQFFDRNSDYSDYFRYDYLMVKNAFYGMPKCAN